MQKFLGKIRNTRRYFVLNKAFGSIQNEITLFDFHVDLSWSTFIKPYWQLPKRKKHTLKREMKTSFENISISDSSAAVLERKAIKLQVLLLLRCITAAKRGGSFAPYLSCSILLPPVLLSFHTWSSFLPGAMFVRLLYQLMYFTVTVGICEGF